MVIALRLDTNDGNEGTDTRGSRLTREAIKERRGEKKKEKEALKRSYEEYGRRIRSKMKNDTIKEHQVEKEKTEFKMQQLYEAYEEKVQLKMKREAEERVSKKKMVIEMEKDRVTMAMTFSSINNNYDENEAKYNKLGEGMIKALQTFQISMRKIHSKGYNNDKELPMTRSHNTTVTTPPTTTTTATTLTTT